MVVTETLPVGTTFDAAASTAGWVEVSPGVFEFTAGTLAAGETRDIVFTVIVDSEVPAGFELVNNTVTIADDGANGPDSNLADNTGMDDTPVTAAPDFVIVKDDGQTNVAVGDTVTVSYTHLTLPTIYSV